MIEKLIDQHNGLITKTIVIFLFPYSFTIKGYM